VKFSSCLCFLALFSLACAHVRRPASSNASAISTADELAHFDWRTRNQVRGDDVLLIRTDSVNIAPLVQPRRWMCRESPATAPGMVDLMVRFAAPMSGAYNVVAIGEMDLEQHQAVPLNAAGLRADRPETVTCHFAVPADQTVRAVHVTRYELWCYEGHCAYSGIPVDTVPEVAINGRAVANGPRHSFFGAYLTEVRPPM